MKTTNFLLTMILITLLFIMISLGMLRSQLPSCPSYYDGEGNTLTHQEVDSLVKSHYVHLIQKP